MAMDAPVDEVVAELLVAVEVNNYDEIFLCE